MDVKDKKLLSLLDENSRVQSSVLAKKLKTSRQIVDYRINQFQKKGMIKNFTTLVNPFQFVNNIWHTYIKLQMLTPEIENELYAYLQKQKQIWWVAKCNGEWDLIFSVAGDSINILDDTLQKFRSKFSNYISEEQTTTLISAISFPRGYFLNKRTQKKVYAESKKSDKLDEKNIAILRLLATNARLPATKIASKLNLSARQVIYRIKELEKKGTVCSYRTFLDLKKINYDYYKVCFYASQYTKELENQLLTWCENNSYAVFFVRKIAPWTFEIEFETPDFKTMNDVLSELKNLFGDKIKRSESTVVLEEFKGELNIL